MCYTIRFKSSENRPFAACSPNRRPWHRLDEQRLKPPMPRQELIGHGIEASDCPNPRHPRLDCLAISAGEEKGKGAILFGPRFAR